MRKIQILFAAFFFVFSYCPTTFAELQKIPLDTSHFWFSYYVYSDSGGPPRNLNPNDSFKILDQTVHISTGYIVDQDHHYVSTMFQKGKLMAYGDFKVELIFKNFTPSNADSQGLYLQIGNDISDGNVRSVRYCEIGITKLGPYYQYSTRVWPDGTGGLRLSSDFNSGTFIIEQKGTNITLSVKEIPHETWTYSGINPDDFWIRFDTRSKPSGKVEVDIFSISTEGVEIDAAGD